MKLKPAAMRRRPAAASPAPPARKTKPRQAPRKVKLKASVARTARDDDEFEEYEDEEPNMKFGQAFLIVLILHVVAVAGVLTFNSIKAKQIAAGDEAAGEEVVAETTTAEKTDAPEVTTNTSAPKTAAAATAAAGTQKPTAAAGQKLYKVLPGDTLTHIAEKHGVTIDALEKANEISSYSTIRVGQELVIPGNEPVTAAKPTQKVAAAKPAAKPASKPASAPPAADVPPGGVYVVVSGDNPYSIAKRFGVSYDALMKANNIDDPTKLQIGEELKIPSGN